MFFYEVLRDGVFTAGQKTATIRKRTALYE
jgi:hypothetical protein